MTQQQGGRDEDAPGGVTDTGDGTGGSFGTAATGKTGGKDTAGSKGAADKMVEGMSEAGKDP